jgi:hypothetical protein
MAPVILDGRSLTPQSVEKIAFGEQVSIDAATRPISGLFSQVKRMAAAVTGSPADR